MHGPTTTLERAVLESLDAFGVAAVVLEGRRIVYANRSAAAFAGTTPEAMTAASDFLDLVHPDDHADVEARMAKRLRGEMPRHYVLPLRLRDGRRVHLEIDVHVEPGRQVYVYRDVTERVEAEAARRQDEKVAAIGQLVAGVAHDVNNPLSVLRCNMAILRDRLDRALDGDERARAIRLLDANERAVRRVAAIMRRLQVLASPQAAKRPPSDLVPVLIAVVEDVRRYAVECDVAVELPVLPPVPCDAEVVGEAVRALLVNGVEAAPQGRVRLTARAERDHVAIVVEDDGPGFSPEAFDRRFEPFFTTKPTGNVGIGLTLARLVAHDHGGSVTVENPPSGGARLTVRLPLGGP